MHSRIIKEPLLGIACIAILGVILTLGLWPFHAPRNEVTWLQDRNGLRFGDYGTVTSSGVFQAASSPHESSCSIEIWLQAALADNEGTILTFYVHPQSLRFSLHQSITDLLLQRGSARAARIYVDGLFRSAPSTFVTITSGAQGTTVYINGTAARTAPQFRLAASDCTGRLILGDSALQQDTWSGQVRGLAIYYSELPAATVLRHYHAWTEKGQPGVGQIEHLAGLYLFNERAGNIVYNHAGPGVNLVIPQTYTVLDEILLKPFWDEFNSSWGYWMNVLKNMVGFVPLGFCYYAYLTLVRKSKRAGIVTVILGFAVSLTIELLQALLPTRDSGTTDLITNTLGTWIGVLLSRAASAQWARHMAVNRKTRSVI